MGLMSGLGSISVKGVRKKGKGKIDSGKKVIEKMWVQILSEATMPKGRDYEIYDKVIAFRAGTKFDEQKIREISREFIEKSKFFGLFLTQESVVKKIIAGIF